MQDKGCIFAAGTELRTMRQEEAVLQAEEDLIMVDLLELEGCLEFYEKTGGPLHISLDPFEIRNAILVAQISVARCGRDRLAVRSFSCEYGHERLVGVMMEQIEQFAKFYGYLLIGENGRCSDENGTYVYDERRNKYGYDSWRKCKRQYFV